MKNMNMYIYIHIYGNFIFSYYQSLKLNIGISKFVITKTLYFNTC